MTASLEQIEQAIDNFDFEQAREMLREELRERPSADAYYLASTIAEGDIQRTFFLEKALALDPNHPKAAAAMGKSKPASTTKESVGQAVKFEAVPRQIPISNMKANRRWQKIISVVVMLAFFAPWIRSCDTDYNGFQSTYIMGSSILGIFTNQSTASLVNILLGLIQFFGLVSILVYCSLNISTFLIRIKDAREQIWTGVMLVLASAGLIGLSIPLLARLVSQSSGNSLKDLLWGYWVTWLGMVAGVWLDAKAYFRRKT